MNVFVIIVGLMFLFHLILTPKEVLEEKYSTLVRVVLLMFQVIIIWLAFVYLFVEYCL